MGQTFAVTASVTWKSFNCGPLAFIFNVNGSYAGSGQGGLSYTQNLTISTSGIAQIAVLATCTLADNSVIKSAVASVDVECGYPDSSTQIARPTWPINTEYVEFAGPGQQHLGWTDIEDAFDNETLHPVQCKQFCKNDSVVWKIVGGMDILKGSNQQGRILKEISTKRLLANGQVVTRTSSYQEATLDHEDIHVNAWLGLRDRYHALLIGEFNDQQACEQHMNAAEIAFVADYNATQNKESCHSSSTWQNEFIWVADPNSAQEGYSTTKYSAACEP